jgi:predicted aminopeptidase
MTTVHVTHPTRSRYQLYCASTKQNDVHAQWCTRQALSDHHSIAVWQQQVNGQMSMMPSAASVRGMITTPNNHTRMTHRPGMA